MRRAMEYGCMAGLPLLTHCEDAALAGGGVMHEGVVSTVLGLPGMPAEAESVVVYRDIQLAALTGAHLHVQHVSCAETVGLVRRAKDRGLRVTAETSPHYLTLTDEAVRGYDTRTQGEPAASPGGGPGRAAQRPAGRRHRRHCLGPRAAARDGQGAGLRGRGAGHDRPGDQRGRVHGGSTTTGC